MPIVATRATARFTTSWAARTRPAHRGGLEPAQDAPLPVTGHHRGQPLQRERDGDERDQDRLVDGDERLAAEAAPGPEDTIP